MARLQESLAHKSSLPLPCRHMQRCTRRHMPVACRDPGASLEEYLSQRVQVRTVGQDPGPQNHQRYGFLNQSP